MTDPIQTAIEKAEETFIEFLGSTQTWTEMERVRAAIRSLAALVREYGHKQNCGCCSGCSIQHKSMHPYLDPSCLPESREEKP